MELPSIRYLTQAGGKMNSSLAKEYAEYSKQKKIKFVVMYGQTEAAPRMGYLPYDKFFEKPTSMGIAIPDGKFLLIDETGEEIQVPDIEGELVYHGDNVMMGYAENEYDLSTGDNMKGILHTGDIAKFDQDSFYYITGRKKRFIKIYGNRVNLDEIERYLKSKDIECACGGQDDRLLIATTEKHKIDKIRKTVIDLYGFNHKVIHVIHKRSLMQNESGKLLHNKIFQDYSGNQ